MTFLFFFDERRRDDPDDSAGARERDERASYGAHEPYSAPAVHEVPGVFGENAGKASGSLDESGAIAGVRAATAEGS